MGTFVNLPIGEVNAPVKKLRSGAKKAPNGGIVLGAYAWVENVLPQTAQTSAGFIHAPSLNQSTTAAILRAGYLAHSGAAAAARPFDVDGKPFGTIYIGVTLSLLADRLERLGVAFALIVIADVILTLLATASLRRLLFQEMWPFPAVSWSARVTESLPPPPAQQDELSGLAERFNRLSREVHSEHNQWETGRSNVFDIVRSIHDGVVLVDSGGSLLFANREARAVLGLDKTPGVEGRPLGVLLRRNHPLVAMAEAALSSYEEVPYQGKPLHPTHPDSLAAVATLLGMSPAPAPRCYACRARASRALLCCSRAAAGARRC